jgi:hypothetical protein
MKRSMTCAAATSKVRPSWFLRNTKLWSRKASVERPAVHAQNSLRKWIRDDGIGSL